MTNDNPRIDVEKVMARINQAKEDIMEAETEGSHAFLAGYINALEDVIHYRKFDMEDSE